MSDTKHALTWADILLILVLSTVGAGVCVLAVRTTGKAMAGRAPGEAAFQDSAGVPRLEQALSEAGDERSAVATRLRELRFRQMRDSAGLALADADLVTLRTATPPAPRVATDSLVRERTRLHRSLRTDAALAVRLRAAATAIGDTMIVRRRAVADARRSAAERFRGARRRFALERAGWTAAGATTAAALLLATAAFLLRPRPGRTALVRRGRAIGISAVLIALSLAHQLLGAPLTILLGALAALLALLPHVNHAS
jgi:hypothetical protein